MPTCDKESVMIDTRLEYPRPQFRRDDWIALNGVWEFEFDDDDSGVARNLPAGRTALSGTINVPFTYEYEASGIGETQPHEIVWYRRTFTPGAAQLRRRALLCFNACDWRATVWVNGRFAAEHEGGFAPFSADITPLLKRGENVIVVRCYDPLDPAIPRGKQSWKGPFGCWYVPNTGIWQSVWLEFFDGDCISEWTCTPDVDGYQFSGELTTLYGAADELEIELGYRGNVVKRQKFTLDGRRTRWCVSLMELDFVDESFLWSPERPNLFTFELRLLKGGRVLDVVHTRQGLRKISIDESGNICLNNARYYQRLILDQGYWKESGLTPPSAEAVKKDIELAKAAGFNGARKHQKFEDPYFYYYADELGFLAWCEMPSAYHFSAGTVAAQMREWQEIVRAARNFTCIVCYVPLNESWGVRKILSDGAQQDYARSLYYITKALDPSRLVSTNDGWENLDATDLITVHDYAYDSSQFAQKYSGEGYDDLYPSSRKLMAEGCYYGGQPVLFTEFGGIALAKCEGDGKWGYNSGAKSEEEFFARLENLMQGIRQCAFQGFCYTQLTDVQQEVNGLFDESRRPKADLARLKEIFGR